FNEFKDNSETLSDKRKRVGSYTAKGGFENEIEICNKFNNWLNDNEAKEWLNIMGYDCRKIKEINCVVIPVHVSNSTANNYFFKDTDIQTMLKHKKADLQLKLIIKINDVVYYENISLKKANKTAGFNHIDRRWVDFYQELWGFDDDICMWLKLFTGEINPKDKKEQINNFKNLRDKRRVFIDEMDENIQNKIINFFEKNKILVISDILKGRGGLSADWILVTMFDEISETTSWILVDINTAMNFYGQGNTILSSKGSLYIGRIFMQRKGGTGNPNQLQFKFNPNQLFEINSGKE
ncbi:MAG: hypothetical protein NTU73_06525, partial [Ignavibacteriae bacterium]|nr:hypothetical protein [Ignavibacteriota bacterium]